VILNYLEDKYADEGETFKPETPEMRQLMDLMIRVHDLYVASPNATAPGFSHSQGAMYLSVAWHGPARGMDAATRAAKVGELWKQLLWLESQAGSPYLVGGCDKLTLADLTWFPTCVFMEYMLPRCFGWLPPFEAGSPFPRLAAWYSGVQAAHPEFEAVHASIWSYWEEMEAAGQFKPIVEEVASNPQLKFMYGVPSTVSLNYQEPPPPGKRTGRYINQPAMDDVVDENVAHDVSMHNGRELRPEASIDRLGFELHPWPTACADFRDDEQVVSTYYGEMMELIKATSGASRVLIFDHTVRESGNDNLNAVAGGSAAPVPRVHCDYTADGAPRRLALLGAEGIFSRVRGRMLTEAEVGELAARRFAFINVWRSIDDDHPVMQQPLAVCDEASVSKDDHFLYELIFPDRVGENYSLRYSADHKWYSFPQMTKDECLVFKVYDKKEDGVRFVFHSAFTDPTSPPGAPPRKSIEIRSVAFFDDDAV